jgi:flagellar hook-basal body complex protein FliE
MAFDQVQAISFLTPPDLATGMENRVGNVSGNAQFGRLVTEGIEQVNQQLLGTQTDLQQLALGDVQNLHQVMVRMEETRLSFQLMLQVRNRLLEAYQDVMRMQI